MILTPTEIHGAVTGVMVAALEVWVWKYNIWNVRENIKEWWSRCRKLSSPV